MGIFDFLKSKPKNNSFVSKSDSEENIHRQMQMTPQTLGHLRELDVDENRELKLEYFFYTNTLEKSEELADEIKKLNYTVENGVSAGDKKLFIVTGWTTKMKMTNEVVSNWTKQMCELGFKHDCEFDGWGTSDDQQ